MKRFLVLATALAGLFSITFAQRVHPKEEKKAEIAHQKAEKNEDKREKQYIKDRRKASKEIAEGVHHSTGVNKDGSPDMRIPANKRKAENDARIKSDREAEEKERQRNAAATHQRNQSPTRPNINHQPVNRSNDRVVATDAKGRTIYEGPRGGRYYINANGNKEYIKR